MTFIRGAHPLATMPGESDCRNVWKSFSDAGPVTASSLFAMAYAQGWQDPAKRQQAANGGRASKLPLPHHGKRL